jgi:tetratricopeptide (TPR) repeat protein
MNRERIVFVAVLALLGLLGWRLFAKEAPRFSGRAVVAKELPESRIPPADPVVTLTSSGIRRDSFERPSADQPLPLLVLPMPPLADLPSLMPPPWPDAGAATWSDHLYTRPARLLGAAGDLVETGDSAEELATAPANPAAPQTDFSAQYDSLHLDSLSIIWGRILNEDRFALKVGDTLRFQQVDPRTGKNLYAVQEYPAGRYQNFSFARTLANQIERDATAWRGQIGPARADDLRAFLRQLLGHGLLEPVAFQRAEELATLLVRAAPDDVDNWMALGEIWERTFALDRAFALYASLGGTELPGAAAALPAGLPQSAGRFREHPAPRVRMAAVLLLLGRADLAEAQLRAAVALDPRDADAAIDLGLLELTTGRAAEAVARLLVARRHSSGASRLLVSLRAGVALGRAQLATRAWADAAKTFEDAVAAAPLEDPLAVAAQCGRIAAAYLAGDFGTAEEVAQDAVSRLGAHPRLLYLRGITAAAHGGAAGEVLRDLRAAATSSPLDAAPALAARAFWLDQLGESEEAGDSLRQALALDPSLAYARWLAAQWALRDGDLDAAAAGFEGLMRESPDCAAALAGLGWLLMTSDDPVRAEVALRSAAKRAPEHARPGGPESGVWADLALRRGFNFLVLGQPAAARAAFETALDLEPDLAAARNGVAAALYSQGDLAAAVAEFSLLQDALRDAPDDPQYLYAKLWQTRIEVHDKLRRWRDGFDGRRLRHGWDTQSQARLGVEPRLEGGALLIRGIHREKGETRAFREVPAMAFRSAAMDIAATAEHRGDAGAYLALQNRGRETWIFKVYRDRDGMLHWTTTRSGKQVFQRLGVSVKAGEPFRVEFRLDREPTQPVLQVWVDGVNVFAEQVPNLRNPTGMAAAGVFVETANALAVDALLDNLELVYAAQ